MGLFRSERIFRTLGSAPGGIVFYQFEFRQKGKESFKRYAMIFKSAVADTFFLDLSDPFQDMASFAVNGVNLKFIFCIVTIIDNRICIVLHRAV